MYERLDSRLRGNDDCEGEGVVDSLHPPPLSGRAARRDVYSEFAALNSRKLAANRPMLFLAQKGILVFEVRPHYSGCIERDHLDH